MAGVRKAVDLFGKAMRETGHAMDRLTLTAAENEIFRDTFARHRQMMPLKEKAPTVADSAFVAPNAAIVGSVKLMDSSNVRNYSSVFSSSKWKCLTSFVCLLCFVFSSYQRRSGIAV